MRNLKSQFRPPSDIENAKRLLAAIHDGHFAIIDKRRFARRRFWTRKLRFARAFQPRKNEGPVCPAGFGSGNSNWRRHRLAVCFCSATTFDKTRRHFKQARAHFFAGKSVSGDFRLHRHRRVLKGGLAAVTFSKPISRKPSPPITTG